MCYIQIKASNPIQNPSLSSAAAVQNHIVMKYTL